jgi:polyisoprenyl-phosphate glycosyltransferase
LISVVIPVYRNSATLAELHRRLRNVLDAEGRASEIIFVDDASPDDSAAVLKDLARFDSRVMVVSLLRNAGQHRAVLCGLAVARGDVVVMDADLQDAPEAIPGLLHKMREGPAAVFAGRRGDFAAWPRRLTSRTFKYVLHLLCGVPADAGMFVALRADLVQHLIRVEPGPSVVAMVGCAGEPITSIPVPRARRVTGLSSYTSWARARMALLAIAWVLRHKRQAARAA